ncbi:adenosine deaminase [Psychrobium sp. 1_MG-2023]|uniref:adenosine deaminase n=1 Tax=Psychrobium sp. 1_MG-2023 TaxID=3062624 RepID=UPI0027337CC3|nr:adenosine deaminase [Psychrobium sp. 1_MG-2023]MDP2560481.1 adenosine deaminase [Psychrobium sp. 1_MG-2023]
MINKNLPLTDVHRHLDGNIRLQTIIDLGQQFNINLPAYDLATLKPHVQVVEKEPSLVAFLAKLDWMVGVIGDLEAAKRIAFENVEDAFNAGLDYTELRFSPGYMAMSHKLPAQGIVEAVIDGVRQGQAKYDVKVNLIGILSRTFGVDACQVELDALLSQKNKLVAIDLAGDELGFPSHLYLDQFKQARDSGLNITVHAGEAAGSEAIWYAIEKLGADRIGHGVKAIEDPKLMDYLAKHQIGIESCPTSNIQTSTVANYQNHPIKPFLEHGLLVSLNTDDPGVSDIEIAHEYTTAAQAIGLTQAHLTQLQHNGLTQSYLSASEKQQLIEKCKSR